MTNRISLALAFALLMGVSPVFAGTCPSGQVLRKIGTIFNSAAAADLFTGQIVDGPMTIDAWSWACTGTACTPTVYDGAVTPREVGASHRFGERAGGASGGGVAEFDPPLGFADGITVSGLNVAGFMVYTCQP